MQTEAEAHCPTLDDLMQTLPSSLRGLEPRVQIKAPGELVPPEGCDGLSAPAPPPASGCWRFWAFLGLRLHCSLPSLPVSSLPSLTRPSAVGLVAIPIPGDSYLICIFECPYQGHIRGSRGISWGPCYTWDVLEVPGKGSLSAKGKPPGVGGDQRGVSRVFPASQREWRPEREEGRGIKSCPVGTAPLQPSSAPQCWDTWDLMSPCHRGRLGWHWPKF